MNWWFVTRYSVYLLFVWIYFRFVSDWWYRLHVYFRSSSCFSIAKKLSNKFKPVSCWRRLLTFHINQYVDCRCSLYIWKSEGIVVFFFITIYIKIYFSLSRFHYILYANTINNISCMDLMHWMWESKKRHIKFNAYFYFEFEYVKFL